MAHATTVAQATRRSALIIALYVGRNREAEEGKAVSILSRTAAAAEAASTHLNHVQIINAAAHAVVAIDSLQGLSLFDLLFKIVCHNLL